LGKLAAQVTLFAARNAASRCIQNAVADASNIAATSVATKPADRGISWFQLLPAGVAKQSHDQLKIGL
jgi:hypothetical protein